MTRSSVAVSAVLLLTIAGDPGATAQTGGSRPAYSSSATAILVDVVVRDRKGRPMIDLSAAEFEIAEDGIAQKLDSFTRLHHGGGIGVGVAWKTAQKSVAIMPTASGDGPAGTAAENTSEEATTAIVFDHLSSESLSLAQRATLDYVPKSGDSGVRVGVFSTDAGARVLQRYTTDRTLVRKAIQQLVPFGTSVEDQKAERIDDLINRRRELLGEAAATTSLVPSGNAAAVSQNTSALGERETELRQVQTELNMLRSFDDFDRTYKGYDTSLGLLAVVRSLAEYPGRKTIVLFSEGLPASPVLSAKLDHIIDAANGANVTTYVIDANGLRAKSALTNTKKELDTFVEERLGQLASGTNRTEQPLAMGFERVEDTLKLDSRTGLARLAEWTGGFLVEDSNNLASAFRRIDEDNQFHYLLTYSPKNSVLDGKFRAIQVKVRRPGAQVFARKGYRAVASPRGIDAGSYEIPALAMLDRTPLPNAFGVYAAGFTFPDPARPGLTPVIVHVGTDALRFAIDQQRATYSAQAAVVVRIRDGRGRAVETLSQQYVLSGDAKDLEAAKKGEILFYREPDLQPGVYTMETIVFDAIGQQGSARVATLNISKPDASGIDMSSLVLVRRGEDVSNAPSEGAAPLYVGHTLLYPNLGEPIRKSSATELPFYFTLYGNTRGVTAHAQLLRNGEAVAEAPVPLAESSGPRLQHVGRIPIDTLPLGTYELRIRATDGTHDISRTAFFTLQQ